MHDRSDGPSVHEEKEMEKAKEKEKEEEGRRRKRKGNDNLKVVAHHGQLVLEFKMVSKKNVAKLFKLF